MARRAIKPAPLPVTGEAAPPSPPSLRAGEGYWERGTSPAATDAHQDRAPALAITVLGERPVFACGRWLQPGPATACPAGYFSARQHRELAAHPGLRVRPAPEAAP